MKKYIASIMGGALFVGFVAYATVQTQPNREEQLSNQEMTVLENTKISPLENSVLPKKSPSPSVLSATVTESSNVNKKEDLKKYYDDDDDDDRYEEEDDD